MTQLWCRDPTRNEIRDLDKLRVICAATSCGLSTLSTQSLIQRRGKRLLLKVLRSPLHFLHHSRLLFHIICACCFPPFATAFPVASCQLGDEHLSRITVEASFRSHEQISYFMHCHSLRTSIVSPYHKNNMTAYSFCCAPSVDPLQLALSWL